MSAQGPDQFQPGYIALYRSGELERRAGALEARLGSCDLCPRRCGVNRLQGEPGFCRSGPRALVASYCDHHGEEPAISGSRGSGTVFFGGCTLKCVFCQNFQISQGRLPPSWEVGAAELARRMVYLQDTLGCHNINLVSPTHFVPQIVRALVQAVPMGLHIPLVYNTNGYDSLPVVNALDGIVDIYLPDLKYASDIPARKFSQAKRYPAHARVALREMHRQVGSLVLGQDGVARRGLVVRVLVLPNGMGGCEESLRWLARELGRDVTVSLMAQYNPCHRAHRVPALGRRISLPEYSRVRDTLERLGIQNGWVQELDAASAYAPDFSREGHPFEPAAAQAQSVAEYP